MLRNTQLAQSNLNSISNNFIIDYNMKYSQIITPKQCIMTHSTCYLSQTKKIIPKGIIVHSTGVNNPYLKRYAQPSKDDKNYNELISTIGYNSIGNDYNHTFQKEGYHAWIGKLSDDTVTSIQTLPWDYQASGVGSGPNGTCENNWIQVIICEDDLNDGNYFIQIYQELCQLIAYLCLIYKIDPQKYVTINAQDVPTILSHQECGDLGMGTKFIDVKHWFSIYNHTMGNVKFEVRRLLNSINNPTENLKRSSYLIIQPPLFEPYEIKITAKKVNIRSGPGSDENIVKTVKKNQTLTISKEQDGWGKTEYGWVNLKYAQKLSED